MSNAPRVKLATSLGDIIMELYADKTPETVANFIEYVSDGFYNGTIFHRVIDGFMIQGGGMDGDLHQKKTRDPISNEAANGPSNLRGTVAMARTSAPHSASAQFFINVENNVFLDHTAPNTQGWGYCVFGEVVEGMDTVDEIKTCETETRNGMQDVPVENIFITAADVLTPD